MSQHRIDEGYARARTRLAQPPPWGSGRPLAIYGAGTFGRSILRNLRKHGIPVTAFVDRAATPGQEAEGIAVVHPDTMAPSTWADLIVIIAVHNPKASVRAIQDDLNARDCPQVLTPIHLADHLGPAFGTHFWLGPTSILLDHANEIATTRHMLDPDSLELYDAVLAHRLSGDYHMLPEPSLGLDDYLPPDLVAWRSPLRVIDGGAYDGDTLRGLMAHGHSLEAVAAFEPDPSNFAKLSAWASTQPGLNATLWPCGLHAHLAQLQFAGGQGESSAVSAEGSITVQCVSVDESLVGFRPNLLKLDVEGAEPDALLGARQTLLAHKPFVIAGLYHHPTHLWEVPQLLHRICPGYRLHLRLHAHNGFDLWLHAVPEGGIA